MRIVSCWFLDKFILVIFPMLSRNFILLFCLSKLKNSSDVSKNKESLKKKRETAYRSIENYLFSTVSKFKLYLIRKSIRASWWKKEQLTENWVIWLAPH